jgi:hypothetical protein
MSAWVIVLLAVVIAAGVVIVIAVVGGQAGRNRGYEGMGGDTIVRYQRCPVCKKWRMVVPVPAAELSDEDRRVAGERNDFKLP